jgi:uncharacterized membrane protein YfcA
VWDAFSFSLAALGIFLVGLSKAGFGGGLGILTTPLCVIAFHHRGLSPAFALGVLLPLLCAADSISLYYYWTKWRAENLLYLLPGAVAGTVAGLYLIHHFSPRQLNSAIGLICIAFVLFQLLRQQIFKAEGAFAPNHAVGIPCGIGAGITSTFANGAGPLVAMFLIPQKLPKEIYVGSTVLIFAWINWIKLAFFIPFKIVTERTIWVSLSLAIFVPLGVWAGIWLNRIFPEKLFMKVVYLLTFLAGLELLWK